MRADDGHPADGEALLHVGSGAAADDGHERVASDQAPELRTRLGGRVGVGGPIDDRREDAVEVEQDPRLPRRRREAFEQRVGGRGHTP